MILRQRIIKVLEVSQNANLLDNLDLRPIPVKDRQWGIVTYGVFWMGAISAAGAWISTPLTSGLNVWSGVFAMFGGMILSSIGLALNGRAGGVYRIAYPVICRSCFGVYGAYWPMFCRVLVTLAFSAIGIATAAQLLRYES
jgi:NCS1 family nucleobase:cation symporter-1